MEGFFKRAPALQQRRGLSKRSEPVAARGASGGWLCPMSKISLTHAGGRAWERGVSPGLPLCDVLAGSSVAIAGTLRATCAGENLLDGPAAFSKVIDELRARAQVRALRGLSATMRRCRDWWVIRSSQGLLEGRWNDLVDHEASPVDCSWQRPKRRLHDG